MRSITLLAVVAAIGLPGCGGDTPADVIGGWADTLRSGDTRGAAEYFAVPATVANAGPRERLRSRRDVVLFNASLPCGARLEGTQERDDGFVVATFRLTARRGASGCAGGRGQIARVAIRVRDGHITDWLRVADSPAAGPTLDV